ncbi:hypothetical protein PAMP_018859 [Pampus punctatissimus]
MRSATSILTRHHPEVRRMSRVEGLRANSSQFTLEKKPFRILGGSIHYFRVPRAYWEDRLLKMKACGLNTLTTYVPWNLHEAERGTFNFQDHWLLQDKNMQLRTTYPGFVDAVNLFFDKLVSVIKPMMFEEGGPIIAVQVENEYGSYARDDRYMAFIKDCLQSRGINELLLTSDNWEGLRYGGVEGDMLTVVSEILERGISINLYMFHGGTSFGFMNGAMDYGTYKPQVTSYDEPLPEVPPPQERRAYDAIVIQQYLSLWDSLQFTDKPYRSERPVNMENLPVNNNNGQSYGYTLYETTITSGGALNSRNNIRDRALLFVDRQYVGSLDYKIQELTLPDGKVQKLDRKVAPSTAAQEEQENVIFFIILTSSGQWQRDIRSPLLPGFFQAKLHVDGPPRDTFITLPGWGKGAVFVNGQNLGRHWFIGPQHFLYLPGPWLRSGENQIIVFEEQKADGKILFAENPDHGKTIDVYKLPFCTLL